MAWSMEAAGCWHLLPPLCIFPSVYNAAPTRRRIPEARPKQFPVPHPHTCPQVSVLFLALAAIYYIPSYIAGRWMLRCQDK